MPGLFNFHLRELAAVEPCGGPAMTWMDSASCAQKCRIGLASAIVEAYAHASTSCVRGECKYV